MQASFVHTGAYAKAIENSKCVRWEIDRDVICGGHFDYTKTFLPTGLSHVEELRFLGAADSRLLSQVQGRTYAYIFGLVERFIAAKTSDLGRSHTCLLDAEQAERITRAVTPLGAAIPAQTATALPMAA